MILFSRFAYGIQMAGLVLKMVYYWQFHIWRDLFCHLPIRKNSKNSAEENLKKEELGVEEVMKGNST